MPWQPFRRFRRRPSALHAAALLTLLTFGCTTVRAPASAIAPTVPVREGVSDPQVELWLESARAVSPEESARAAAEAHAALQQALAGRQAKDGEPILVVRAQAVSRTGSRRNDQRAAIAGIVVGAVAVVAIVVIVLVSSKGSSGAKAPRVRGGSHGGGRAVPVAHPPVPIRPPRQVPAPVAGGPRPRPHPVQPPPHFHPGAPAPGGGVHADVELAVRAEGPLDDPAPAEEDDANAPWEAPTVCPAAAEVAQMATVTLPPPLPLDVERRSFFDGDRLRLELAYVDPCGGAPLWVKTVHADVDIRDAAAVRRVLDGALDDPSGWTAPRPEQVLFDASFAR